MSKFNNSFANQRNFICGQGIQTNIGGGISTVTTIRNGEVYINGQKISRKNQNSCTVVAVTIEYEDGKTKKKYVQCEDLVIKIAGDCKNVKSENAPVQVQGNAETVTSHNGNVRVGGSVGKTVKTHNGNITIN